jgi:hypothetical protein
VDEHPELRLLEPVHPIRISAARASDADQQANQQRKVRLHFFSEIMVGPLSELLMLKFSFFISRIISDPANSTGP